MLAAAPQPLRHIVYLPVQGDFLQIVGATIVTSLDLYSDPERFLATLQRRLASESD